MCVTSSGRPLPTDLKMFPRPPKLPLHQLQGALLNLLIILSIVLLVLRKHESPEGHVHHYIPQDM